MKAKFLFFIMIATLCIGCSSDSSSSFKEEDLLGKWYLKEESHNGGAFVPYHHDCPTSKDYQEFLVSHEINYFSYGTNCLEDDSQTSVWTLDGNKLSIISFDPAIVDPEVCKILSLTDQELKLKQTAGGQTYEVHLTRN